MGQRGELRRAPAYDGELGAAVARAQEGDEAAFAVAYRIVQPGLLGYLRGLVGDDAEDVASDAWLEIARDLGRFRGDGAGFRRPDDTPPARPAPPDRPADPGRRGHTPATAAECEQGREQGREAVPGHPGRGDGRGRHPPQERPRPSRGAGRAAARTSYSATPAFCVTPLRVTA
ncbi:hypothetical protein SFUMM280S_01577 [Streptomyces fumanus]